MRGVSCQVACVIQGCFGKDVVVGMFADGCLWLLLVGAASARVVGAQVEAVGAAVSSRWLWRCV